MTRPSDISVFVDPFSQHFLRDELFNPESRYNMDDSLAAYLHLRDRFRARGIEVHTADFLLRGDKASATNVYFSLGMVRNYRELAVREDIVPSGFFTIDAPIVQPSTFRALKQISRYFRRIYSYTTSDAVARFGCAGLQFQKFHIPYPYDREFEDLWMRRDRKFLNLLNWNRLCRMSWQELYTERLRALEFFSRYGEIDLYGMYWDRPPYVVGETWIPATATRIHRYLRQHVPFLRMHPYQEVIRKVYRGPAQSKYETQSHYTFTICYENMALPGWVNENIFDCFLVGTIPIYLGAPDITDYVPADCFIDKRRFPTYEDLRVFLKSLSESDIRRYKENARDYLRSERFKPFRKEAFAQIFVCAVEQDLGITLGGAA